MTKLYYLLLFVFLLVSLNLFAQPDTLQEHEIPALQEGYKISPMATLQRVHKLSQINSKRKAGELLLTIDLYYLLFEWNHSTRPDTFLSKLSIDSVLAKQFLHNYDSILKVPHSKYYNMFRHMGIQDQDVRKRMLNCKDTLTCRKLGRFRRLKDTIHASYLFNYVKEHGWPSMKEGAMYATILAIHDHAHHDFYITHLKQAVKEGYGDINALMLINYYLTHEMKNDKIMEEIQNHPHLKVDISEILDYNMPRRLNRIQEEVANACGSSFKWYYIFESPKNQVFADWHAMHRSNHGKGKIMERFQKELQPYCPEKIVNIQVWFHSWYPAEKTALYMVIVYYE